MELLPAGGVKDWSISISGHANAGSAAIERALADLVTGTELSLVQFKTFGTKVFSGSAQITSISLDSPYDGVVGFSAEIKGSGALGYA
jgi:predicted secreted protein